MNKKVLEKIREDLKYYQVKEILDDKIIASGNFIEVGRATYQLGDGTITTKEYITKNKKNSSAAIILPITEDNKIVLIAQARECAKAGGFVEIPAGYIEDGETPKEAAARELMEEVGYAAKEIIELGEAFQDQAISSGCNRYFLAIDCKKVASQSLDETEDIKYYECDYEDVEELLEKNNIKDLNSKYTFLLAKEYRRKRYGI